MATHVGIGFSQGPTTANAAREAALQAKSQLKGKSAELAIVFSSVHYSSLETLHGIRQILGIEKIIGCSTAGIILSGAIENRGIGILAINSEDIKFATGSVLDIATANLRLAGSELARVTTKDLDGSRRSLFIVFIDGLIKNNAPLLKGIQEILGKAFPVVGAGSSDYFRFAETYQYFEEKPLTRSAVALLIGGQLRAGVGSRHGWKPLGKPRKITKADENIIRSIDNQKACRFYEEYLGQELKNLHPKQLIEATAPYPLGIYLEGEKEYLLRNALDILEDGSIVAQGDIPQDSEVHIMISNKDFCQQAALRAAQEAKEALGGRPAKFILIFESLLRYKLLGRAAIREIQIIKEVFGTQIPLLGMCAYGEIAPLKSARLLGEACLQNGTLVIVAVA